MKVISILFFMVICFGNLGLLGASPLVVETPTLDETDHQQSFVHCFKDVTAQDLFDQCRKKDLCDSKPLILTLEQQVDEKRLSVQIEEGAGEDKKTLTDLENGSEDDIRVSLAYKNTSFKDRVFAHCEKVLEHPVLGPIICFGSLYTFLGYLLIKQ